ncbi:MAG: LysR family transcriptional regulator [Opitutaceae bacterium]|nr:LysR family transcriptional regulator [Opitutaceae bacterium]
MNLPDLNLLVPLEVLLAEGSVARAARRLRLSPSAMSRTLTRLREATGDPLLVRAGRRLVPTPRAIELAHRVGLLVQDAAAVLRPAGKLDLARLNRTFTLRTSEGFVETFGPALLERVSSAAPGVRLRFLPKPDRDGAPLREGAADLETGVVDATTAPEIRTRVLFRDRFVGVVRPGHALTQGTVTAERYAAAGHIGISRRGLDRGRIDEALDAAGIERRIHVVVGGFATAIALARATDLVASVPEKHTRALWAGLATFRLPVKVPPIVVSLLWHPRLDADPAHGWLRERVRATCDELVDRDAAGAPAGDSAGRP